MKNNSKAIFLIIVISLYCCCGGTDKTNNKISQEQINIQNGNNLNLHKRSKENLLTRMQLIINGPRDCDEINNAIFRNLPNLRMIYNKRLRDNPGLTGWIGFQFFINENGKVINTEVIETSINDDILKVSLKHSINNWTFKQVKVIDSTVVYFPFCCGSFCGSYNEIMCNGITIKKIKEN